MRERLSDRRKSVNYTVRVVERSGTSTTVHFTVGLYPDGRPGELFIDMHKQGSALRDWSGKMAMLFSVLLQHQVPLSEVCDMFVDFKADPHGRVDGSSVVMCCTSIMDCIARTLLHDYQG